VILVEHLGDLVGLCTVKDVLHIEPDTLSTPRLSASWQRSGGLDGALEEVRGGLDGALESVLARLRDWGDDARARWHRRSYR